MFLIWDRCITAGLIAVLYLSQKIFLFNLIGILRAPNTLYIHYFFTSFTLLLSCEIHPHPPNPYGLLIYHIENTRSLVFLDHRVSHQKYPFFGIS
jgi:hypothetical protein